MNAPLISRILPSSITGPLANAAAAAKRQMVRPVDYVHNSALFNRLMTRLDPHSRFTQFLGYEIGNVVATAAGADGVTALASKVDQTWQTPDMSVADRLAMLATEHPDAAVTVGLGATIIAAPVLRKAAQTLGGDKAATGVEIATAIAASGILGYSVYHATSAIDVAASAFVVGSSFLALSEKNPLLLKLAGLWLATGGAALATFGANGFVDPAQAAAYPKLMNSLTTLSGLYVTGASLLTYGGGMFLTGLFAADETATSAAASSNWLERQFHPTNSRLAKAMQKGLDAPIGWVNNTIVNPAIFWASGAIKNNEPFATSMYARMPWRLMTAGAAMATGTDAGYTFAAAQLLWAFGDLSVGAIRWSSSHSDVAADAEEPITALDVEGIAK